VGAVLKEGAGLTVPQAKQLVETRAKNIKLLGSKSSIMKG
jgi:hypothetical protein